MRVGIREGKIKKVIWSLALYFVFGVREERESVAETNQGRTCSSLWTGKASLLTWLDQVE